jgi:hypothetical protein
VQKELDNPPKVWYGGKNHTFSKNGGNISPKFMKKKLNARRQVKERV